METKIATIKTWLGSGSINLFGLPMSGKDTQGLRLSEALNAEFLSSGLIIRAKEAETRKSYTNGGNLAPTDVFFEWVLPAFSRPDLDGKPLVLSSIGRWSGEENAVMDAAASAGHEIKAAILLNISEADVEARFEAAKILNDRGARPDDQTLETFKNRLAEFRTKTLPVLTHYQALGLLINVNGDQPRDAVFAEIVDKLYARALAEAPTAETA